MGMKGNSISEHLGQGLANSKCAMIAAALTTVTFLKPLREANLYECIYVPGTSTGLFMRYSISSSESPSPVGNLISFRIRKCGAAGSSASPLGL